LISRPEEIRNLHLTDDYIMRFASHPKIIKVVSDLLGGTTDIKIFATRMVCKLPKVGEGVPWHQDSSYYNLSENAMVHLWLGRTSQLLLTEKKTSFQF